MVSDAFFQELVTRTDDARRDFETHDAVQEAVAHGMDLPRYRRLLLELYRVVWHFNPVSAAAASRMGDEHEPVRRFLYRHMHEEAGHEQWVMGDLAAMGVGLEQVLSHQPQVNTLTLVGYNYWAADRRHPCSVLGMLYALEVIASVYAGPFVSALKERLFLEGDRGVSFLQSHATLDVEHMRQLREVLDPLREPAAREAIVESVTVNFQQFTRIVEAS